MTRTTQLVTAVTRPKSGRFGRPTRHRATAEVQDPGTAQSVYRLATGWRSGDRIPLLAKLSAPVQTDSEPAQPPVQWAPGVFPRE